MATRVSYASLETILRDLAATTVRMGADSIHIEGGFRWSKSGEATLRRKLGATCRGDVPDLYPAGVRIVITRGGKPYPIPCTTYPNWLDNFRIAQRTISTLYSLFEVHGAGGGGVDAFDVLFGAMTEALARLQLGDGAQPWYQRLGVPPDADRATIEAAHKLAARLNHPDRGGDTAAMAAINNARDEGLRQLAAWANWRRAICLPPLRQSKLCQPRTLMVG